jgi:rhodanese-related sulfurtransferase
MTGQPSTPPPPPPLDARGLPVGYPFKPDWEVTPRDTRSAMRAGEADRPVLLDCRRPDEWDRARIEGAVLIPMADVERRADELETDDGRRDRPIIVHCHHGARSLRVAATLRALGFTDVRSMAGGIDLWSIDIDPRVPRY